MPGIGQLGICRDRPARGIVFAVTFTFLFCYCVFSLFYEQWASAPCSSEFTHKNFVDGMGNFTKLAAGENGHNIAKQGQPLGDKCDLCSRKWLFIVGTGRSGSTTLLNMIDVIPFFRISGENSGVAQLLFGLHQAAERVNRNNKHRLRPGNNTLDAVARSLRSKSPWFAFRTFEVGSRLCAMQAYVLTMLGESGENGSNEVIGWKEIRYEEASDLDFMRLLFPCAKFLVNIRRDTATQVKSSFQKKQNTVQSLNKFNLMLMGWSERQPRDTVRVMAVEDFSVPTFNELLDFLGVSGCRYRRVLNLHKNGSYSGDNDMGSVIHCFNNSSS